ncbi:MAG: T9SS type A sorting domain-containing protein [Lewinella sp.]|nr:T9SS type A sorting domain-containing protein [Lewinella sp.]
MWDNYGNLVYENTYNILEFSVDVSDFDEGVYILQITSEQGVYIQQVLVE